MILQVRTVLLNCCTFTVLPAVHSRFTQPSACYSAEEARQTGASPASGASIAAKERGRVSRGTFSLDRGTCAALVKKIKYFSPRKPSTPLKQTAVKDFFVFKPRNFPELFPSFFMSPDTAPFEDTFRKVLPMPSCKAPCIRTLSKPSSYNRPASV